MILKEEERGHASIKDFVDVTIQRLKKYTKNIKKD